MTIGNCNTLNTIRIQLAKLILPSDFVAIRQWFYEELLAQADSSPIVLPEIETRRDRTAQDE